MSNWKKLAGILAPFAPMIGTAVAGPAGAIVGKLLANRLGSGDDPSSIIAAIQEDPQKAREIAREMESANIVELKNAYRLALKELELAGGQIEVNKIEAASKSLFVSGWRPGVGWVCLLALAVNHLLLPIVNIFTPIPQIDDSSLMAILIPLLGIGAYRTVEKIKGVAREN